MMDDNELNSDPLVGMVTGMEELWQNQTYLPIKGWGAPFTGPDHYTDFSGEKSFSNWDFPDLPPLPGWKWSTKWTVDKSGSFGLTDSEGWAYETTFDRLIDSITANKALGTNATTSIVRRRRYIRMRTCVTAEATAQMRARTTALLDIRSKFEISLREKKTDYALTMQYERERKRICGDSWQHMSDNVKECYASMLSNITKLEYIKQYYQEIADAQREHSKRMLAICAKTTKWTAAGKNAGVQSEGDLTDREVAAHKRFETGDTRSSIQEFYEEMNGVNSSVAQGLRCVADMIVQDLFQVIDSNVKDMKMLQQELKGDIDNMDNYSAKEEAVSKALVKLDACFYAVSKADEAEILRLSKVISGEMTDDPDFIESLSQSAKTGEAVKPNVYNYFYEAAGKDSEDMWAAHYAYRDAVRRCWDSFNHLEKSVNKAALLKLQCNQATCIVLTSTRRMFIKEQCATWSDTFPSSKVSSDIFAEKRDHAGAAFDETSHSFSSDAVTPVSEAGDAGGESFVFERNLPILPACTSVLKEGVIRYCSGEDTRKAVIAMTTNLGGKSPGGTSTVTGIPWQRLWGILSSDGVVHVLSYEEADRESNEALNCRKLLRSIPVRGSEIISHSSDLGLFPLMMEIIPKTASLMDSVMQISKKDAYILGLNDKETEEWFTAIMHPVIGAVYRPPAAGNKKGTSAAMSPHRKNSLTPGSSSSMIAVSAVLAAEESESKSDYKQGMELFASKGAKRNQAVVSPGDPNSSSSAVSLASAHTDTALKRSESALLEAAKLAEGWNFSNHDDDTDDRIESPVADA